MKSEVHEVIEDVMMVLGPVFHKHKDWETIRVAMCMVMARVIQATPFNGQEPQILSQCKEDIEHALAQILKIEEDAINAKAAKRDRALSAIEGFDQFGRINGHEQVPEKDHKAEDDKEDDGFNPDGPRAYAP